MKKKYSLYSVDLFGKEYSTKAPRSYCNRGIRTSQYSQPRPECIQPTQAYSKGIFFMKKNSNEEKYNLSGVW